MRKISMLFAVCCLLLFAACTSLGGVVQSTSQTNNAANNASTGASMLSSLLSGLLGSTSQLTAESIVGTWQFSGSDCVFESENYLLKAGGEVAAAKVEEKVDGLLAKVGLKAGACSYTFNADGTYVVYIGGRQMTGNYVLDVENKTITMTYLAGVMQMQARVAYTGNTLSLLYEGDKVLKLAQTMAKVSGGTTGTTLSSLMNQYDGMLVGLKMTK